MSETPRWIALPDLGYGELNGAQIVDRDSGLVVAVAIGDVPQLNSVATAALIVTAVNSHTALIAALEEATYALGQTGQYPAMAQRCAAAIAAAKRGTEG